MPKIGDDTLERALLGYLLINNKEIGLIDDLDENDFCSETNKKLFKTMKKFYENGEKADYFSITERTNIPEKYLDGLVDSIPGLFQADLQIKKLKEYTLYRKLFQIQTTAGELLNKRTDPYEIAEFIETNIKSINSINDVNYLTLADSFMMFDEEVKKKEDARNKNQMSGITSGFTALDHFTSGFEGGQLVIIAARPAMGKTSLALNMAFEEAKRGYPVAFFSLEMNHKQLRNKIVSSVANVNYKKIKDGFLSRDEKNTITELMSMIIQSPLFLGDTTNIEISNFRSQVRKLKREKNLKALYIDYLQLMAKGNDLVKEISNITRTFKLLAIELDIPIILLSQLSRKTEERQDKRPMMSDLRDSGAIEQDADIIMFLYRDDYYNKKDEPEKDIEQIECIFAKNREGSTGTAKLNFFKNYSYFCDIVEAKYDAVH